MNNYEDPAIKGLYYIPDYLTPQETADIMKYLKESKEWFNIGKFAASRRVIHFGYSYAYDRSGIDEVDPIPDYFQQLVTPDRINKYFANLVLKDELDQLIINEYKPGQGIHPHIDHVKYFGEAIVCISVGSGVAIDFTNDQQKKTIYVKPGSLYIMTGPSRYQWRHGIKLATHDVGTKRGTRCSLTYRKIIKDDKDEKD